MSTLVVCLDRNDDVGRKTGIPTPVAGWEAVQSLVIEVGLADPEDSSVNSILEALRVTRSLRDENESAVVAVVSGASDTMVGADRSVARQIEALIEEYAVDSAVVIIDSAQDERLVPIIESRVSVDAVDRVVVRQARDLESTYYLLKQFLADEELRQTILVPIGVALLVFPLLWTIASVAVAVATMIAVIGLFVLYKGLGVDEHVAALPTQAKEALYSGRVSIVTYVVAAGLSLIGVFAGALGVSGLTSPAGDVLLPAMMFAYDSVPWLALAALAASTGRLLDEAIRNDRVRNSYLNLPFGVIAMGLVVRGFSSYFLQRAREINPLYFPRLAFGDTTIEAFALPAGTRLAIFVIFGILISLLGVRIASYVSGTTLEGTEEIAE